MLLPFKLSNGDKHNNATTFDITCAVTDQLINNVDCLPKRDDYELFSEKSHFMASAIVIMHDARLESPKVEQQVSNDNVNCDKEHDGKVVLNDLKSIFLNDEVQCKENHDSIIEWVDHESNKTNNEVHCEKDYDGKVVDHEPSMCMTDALRDDKDVHDDKILKIMSDGFSQMIMNCHIIMM